MNTLKTATQTIQWLNTGAKYVVDMNSTNSTQIGATTSKSSYPLTFEEKIAFLSLAIVLPIMFMLYLACNSSRQRPGNTPTSETQRQQTITRNNIEFRKALIINLKVTQGIDKSDRKRQGT